MLPFKSLNGMFFVHNYDGGDFPDKAVISFGGDRENDIHIRLPKGYTGNININTIP